MIKDFFRRMAVKYLGLVNPGDGVIAPPSVVVKTNAQTVISQGETTIGITPLAMAQIEAEKCIATMQTMVNHYNLHDGDVGEDFAPSCALLFSHAIKSVQKLSDQSEKARSASN